MKAKFGLSQEKSKKIIELLTALASDLHVFYVKTLRCHWNMEDPRFYFLHKLLDEQYNQLAEDVDLVAERIRQIGGYAPGSLKEFLAHARLKEMTSNPSGDKMLSTLADSYEELIIQLRKDIEMTQNIGDPGTADMLTQLLRQFEKADWILRSHL